MFHDLKESRREIFLYLQIISKIFFSIQTLSFESVKSNSLKAAGNNIFLIM